MEKKKNYSSNNEGKLHKLWITMKTTQIKNILLKTTVIACLCDALWLKLLKTAKLIENGGNLSVIDIEDIVVVCESETEDGDFEVVDIL